MIAAAPSQEQVDRIAAELAPDVVHIRLSARPDWSEHPAFYFRIVLSDDASHIDRLASVTEAVSSRLYEELGLSDSDHLSYLRFRSNSEQAQLKDPAWD